MLLLAASASPPRVLAPRAAAAPPELTVRPARWPDDYDAVCAVRKPTEFVVESGGAGFMGQKVVIDDPEEAQKRRVQARLGSALRDKATVLLAEDSSGHSGIANHGHLGEAFRRQRPTRTRRTSTSRRSCGV